MSECEKCPVHNTGNLKKLGIKTVKIKPEKVEKKKEEIKHGFW